MPGPRELFKRDTADLAPRAIAGAGGVFVGGIRHSDDFPHWSQKKVIVITFTQNYEYIIKKKTCFRRQSAKVLGPHKFKELFIVAVPTILPISVTLSHQKRNSSTTHSQTSLLTTKLTNG